MTVKNTAGKRVEHNQADQDNPDFKNITRVDRDCTRTTLQQKKLQVIQNIFQRVQKYFQQREMCKHLFENKAKIHPIFFL